MHTHEPHVTGRQHWLAAMWPLVQERLPRPPARVVEIGCGSLGGFVPMLRSSGYEAVGFDPEAPLGAEYRRLEFERAEPFDAVAAVIASTSLHHVADLDEVLDRVASTLVRAGILVVIEWAWEDFDEQTAAWCFERLGVDDERGWLHRRRDDWIASGQPWFRYLRDWAQREGLHSGETIIRALDARFDRDHLGRGPYFFPDLAGVTAEAEQAAIDAGQLRASRIDYWARAV